MANRAKVDKGSAVLPAVEYPAKVEIPQHVAETVRRERLTEALSDAAQNRVAVVIAPAGYGKTTLLTEYVQSRKEPVAWYSLDERDTDPATFLGYFAAAGQRAQPDFGQNIGAALDAGDKLDATRMTDLLSQAVSAVGGPLTFVLDDFHYLDAADPALRKGIEGWLSRLPADCHVILAGRTHPDLGVLPKMEVRHQAAQVTPDQFAFATDEVVHLLREVLSKDVSLDESQHLASVTEGWAAALVLLAQKLKAGDQTSGSFEHLRTTDTLFQYIAHEQFEPLSDDVKEFLLTSAVLLSMDVATVNELLDIKDARDRLDTLVRMNLFVFPDDSDTEVYRYQRLFRAFLVSNLRAADPDRFHELNVKAASLKERALKWEDALYHLIQAGAWERMVEVIERVGGKMMKEARFDTLAEWIDGLPREATEAQPKLLIWEARAYHYLNQLDRGLALLSRAVEMYQVRGDTLGVAEALTTKGMFLRVKGDYAEALEVLLKARSILEGQAAPLSLVAEARKQLGITLSRSSDLKESIKELSVVVAIYEAEGDAFNIADTSGELAVALGKAGRIAEMTGYLERARQIWQEIGNDHSLVQTLNNLGMVYYFQGDYEQAEREFVKGLEKARQIGNLKWELYLAASLADVKRDTGQHTDALEIYRNALEDGWTVGDAYIVVYIMDAIANTYRQMGDISTAQSWAARAMAEAEKTGGALEMGICETTAGLVARHQGELKDAAIHLEKAVLLLKDKDTKRELTGAYFHLAGVYFSLKKKSKALEMLEACAQEVKELGYDHFLLIEAARNPLLVQYASANKAADGYYAKMLKLIKPSSGSGEAEAEGDETTSNAVYAFGFGHPQVEVGGHEVSDLEWRSEKGKEMFFFFLCNRRPLRKEEIVTALWPDMPEEKTTSAFHSNMYRLRKALYQDVVAKDSGRYVLDPRGRFVFDVEEYQQALQRADAAKCTPEAVPALEKALSLYKGQFAPEFYGEWAETLRWQVGEQHMGLLNSLADAYNRAGEYKKSADVCQQILEQDELSESGWYRLMSNYIQSGQEDAAKYSYNRYIQILSKDEELEEEDMPTFEDLVREIKAGQLRL